MTTSDLKEAATHRAAELASETKKAVHREAVDRAETVQDHLADRADETANAASAAAGQFDPSTVQAEAARRIADRIDSIANQVRSADLDTIVRDVSGFARRNPLLFIGAAAAVGFAATRFLKAQTPATESNREDTDAWARETFSRGSALANDDQQAILAEINGGRHA